jgi:glycosyltransferase involved in cell wall biosynthesis
VKIVLVAPGYHPRVGGVEYVVKSVAERLAKAHEVTVIAGEPDAEKPSEEEISGVRVVRWPTWSPGGAYHLPRRRRELEIPQSNSLLLQ